MDTGPLSIYNSPRGYFFRNAGTSAGILFWGSFISFFNLGAWGMVYAYTPELYPTRIRGTGVGWATACGRFAGVLVPLVIGQMLGRWGAGYESVFLLLSVVLLVSAINVVLLGEETKGQTL